MLGHLVVRLANGAGHTVEGIDLPELDITDLDAVRAHLAATKPEVVVNCAAWTDVDGAEEKEELALKVNGLGAGNVAAAAGELGIFSILISTDYVFDGSITDRPLVESDPTGPLSAYGRTKLAGETAVQQAPGEHAIARTSWLFGS